MRTTTALGWLLAVLLIAVVAERLDVLGQPGSGGDGAAAARPGAVLDGQVTRVVDGDTVKVELDGSRETVRYIGIDTPESVKPGTPVQCFAEKASARNAALVDGRRVRLVVGAEPRDRYGRLLAYVYRAGDGAFVNAVLVREGYARTLTIAPNDRFAPDFASLQASARRDARGLWRAC